MYVVVLVRELPSVAQGLRSLVGQLPADVHEAELRLGINLRPMHPGVNDPVLSRYFYIETPDQTAAERVIAQLQQCKSVEAAYLKPPEGPP